METIRKNKAFLSIFACVFLILCSIFITKQYMTPVNAEDGVPDGSFSTMAAAAARYFNNRLSGICKDDSATMPDTVGNAAGLVGYADLTTDGGTMQSFISNNAGDSVTYDFTKSAMPDVLKQYCYFGHMLQTSGFDQTEFNGLPDSYRMISGILISVAYVLSQGVHAFWKVVLSVLELANPFTLFGSEIGTSTSLSGTFSDAAGSTATGMITTGINGIANWVSGVYTLLKQMSLATTIPVIIVVTLFMWLVVRKGQQFGATFKGLLVKIFFVSIGIPFLFAIYSTAISLVKDFAVDDMSLGTRVVTSTFFDFESWVYANSLGFASANTGLAELKYDAPSGTLPGNLSTSSFNQLKKICMSQNQSIVSTDDNADAAASDIGTNGFTAWDRFVISQTRGNKDGLTDDKPKEVTKSLALLERYAKGDKITAGTYESFAKQTLARTGRLYMDTGASLSGWASTADGSVLKALASLYGLSDSWEEFDKNRVVDFELHTAGTIDVSIEASTIESSVTSRFTEGQWNATGSGVDNIWGNGNLTASGTKENITFSGGGGGSGAGLSAIGMYNYLSSSFESGKITVYSGNDTPGKTAKAEHYAVNAIGTVSMQAVYVLNAFVTLIAFSLIGYGYGISVMLGNMKALFKMIPAVFAGMVGSMRGIASTVILVAALIIEILGTCILHTIASDIMLYVYDLMEGPIVAMISEVCNNIGLASANILIPLFGVVSIAVTVIMTKQLLQWRYAVCQAITESTASIVNKFLGTSVGTPELGKPGATFGQKLGNAALVAGGMAVAAERSGSSLSERLGIAGSSEEKEGLDSSSSETTDAEGNAIGGRNDERDGFASDAEAQEYLDANKDAIPKTGTVENDDGSTTTYDGKGNKTTEYPNGDKVTENADGSKVTETTDENGNKVKITEDAEGNVTTEYADGTKVTENADGSKVTETTDANGNKVKTIEDSEGNVITETTDANGNRTIVKENADGTTTTITDNGDGTTETVTTTADGDVISRDVGPTMPADNSTSATMSEDVIKEQNMQTVQNGDKAGTNRLTSGTISEDGTVTIDGKQYQAINAETGQPYTKADQDAGKAYTLVGADGQVYQDADGNTYSGVSPSKTGSLYRDNNPNGDFIIGGGTTQGGIGTYYDAATGQYYQPAQGGAGGAMSAGAIQGPNGQYYQPTSSSSMPTFGGNTDSGNAGSGGGSSSGYGGGSMPTYNGNAPAGSGGGSAPANSGYGGSNAPAGYGGYVAAGAGYMAGAAAYAQVPGQPGPMGPAGYGGGSSVGNAPVYSNAPAGGGYGGGGGNANYYNVSSGGGNAPASNSGGNTYYNSAPAASGSGGNTYYGGGSSGHTEMGTQQAPVVQVNNQMGMMNTQTAAAATPMTGPVNVTAPAAASGGTPVMGPVTVAAPSVGAAPAAGPVHINNQTGVTNTQTTSVVGGTSAGGGGTAGVSQTYNVTNSLNKSDISEVSSDMIANLKLDNGKHNGLGDKEADNADNEGGFNGLIGDSIDKVSKTIGAVAGAIALDAKSKKNKTKNKGQK